MELAERSIGSAGGTTLDSRVCTRKLLGTGMCGDQHPQRLEPLFVMLQQNWETARVSDQPRTWPSCPSEEASVTFPVSGSTRRRAPVSHGRDELLASPAELWAGPDGCGESRVPSSSLIPGPARSVSRLRLLPFCWRASNREWAISPACHCQIPSVRIAHNVRRMHVRQRT